MNHIFILVILLSSQYIKLEITEFLVSNPMDNSGYKIGEQVNFSCIIKGGDKLSVLLKHNNQYVAENGYCNYVQYKCFLRTIGDAKHFVVTIVRLSWNDGGEWLCIQGRRILSRSIEIRVRGKMAPLRTELVGVGYTSEGRGPDQTVIWGRGARIKPVDLIRGASVRTYCVTECSTHRGTHQWSFQNATMHPVPLSMANETITRCKIDGQGQGLITETSVTLSCQSRAMIGSNRITCATTATNDSQSLFVLCPGGHRPLSLTIGEIVGISITVGVAVLMLVVFFMSAKKVIYRYRYGSMSPGVRV